MNLISSPHEKRYRKGASLSPSELLYLHRRIFSHVYCTVTEGDSLGTCTPPHSDRGTESGGPWGRLCGQWVLGYPSVWDGAGKALGPAEAEPGPGSPWPGTGEPQSPSKPGSGHLRGPSCMPGGAGRAQPGLRAGPRSPSRGPGLAPSCRCCSKQSSQELGLFQPSSQHRS